MQKKIYLFLLFLGAGVTTVLGFYLTKELFFYFPLKAQAEANIFRWEIKEIKGLFAIKEFYTFEANGKRWEGATLLAKPWYLNELAAISALKMKAKQPQFVWFNPNRPANSSVEKFFPIGLFLRTLVSFGVFIYFFGHVRYKRYSRILR